MPSELNWLQRYAASEVVKQGDEGHLSRRQVIKGLAAICGSTAAATAFLAACSNDGSGSSSSAKSARSSTEASASGTTSTLPRTTKVPTPSSTGGVGHLLSIAPDDPDLSAAATTFPGPASSMLGYVARPTAKGKHPGILVIHEIFGLTDHIRDVTRRLAKVGYLAVAVDLASRKGGTDRTDNLAGALTQGPVEDRIADLNAGYSFLSPGGIQRAARSGGVLLRRGHDALLRGRPAQSSGRSVLLRTDPAAPVFDERHQGVDPRSLRRQRSAGQRRHRRPGGG